MRSDIRPMKVAALLPPPAWGGLHAHVETTSKAFKKLGFGDITPVIPDDAHADIIQERFQDAGLTALRMPMSRIRFSGSPKHHINYASNIRQEVKALARLVSENDIDLIQTAGAHHFHGMFGAKTAKCPLVWQLHSDLAPKLARRGVTPVIRSFANAIMVNGKRIAQKFPGIDKTNRPFHVFYPIVNVEKFTFDAADKKKARAALHFDNDTVVIGTVGVRSRQKNHQLLIEAAHQLLLEGYDNIHVLIVGKDVTGGEADYKKDVLDLDETKALLNQNKLSFIQPDNNVENYLAAFDVFALPSISEGMPIAVAEAMCAGLPIVSTDVGSMNEMVVSGYSGALVTPGDVNAFAGALRPLIENSDLRTLYGDSSREKCLAEFSPANSADIHNRAYRSAIAHFDK